jgi:hypothetical protein
MKEGKIKGKERSKKKKTNTEKLKKTEKGEKHAPPYFQTGKKKRHSRDQSCLTLSPDREAVSKIKAPPPLSLSTSVKARNGELIEGRFRQRRRGFKRRQNTF